MKLSLPFLGVLACTATQPGCITSAVLGWARDEVSWSGVGVEVDGRPRNSVGLDVKNVPGTADGLHEVVVPPGWVDREVVDGADGVLEIRPLATLVLETNIRVAYRGRPAWEGLDLSDAAAPLPPEDGAVLPRVAAVVIRGEDRTFHAHVLCEDMRRQRWVRVGVLELGPGLQSSARKPLAIVALPFTVVIDIVTFPFVILGAAYLASVS